MIPIKGFDLLLAALDRLPPRAAERVRGVLLFGEGPERKALEARAAGSRLADRIVFRGFVEDGDAIWRELHILAITSRHEGMPMVLLEALAHGKLVVASRVGGIPEVIQDGVNGLLFDRDSLDSLVARLEAAVLRYPEWAPLREAGRATVRSLGDVGRQADEMLRAYRSRVAL
jgi:glycosyltransferase involved in cell wall biosynthesis